MQRCFVRRPNYRSCMIKRNFSDALRSRTGLAMVNEALCKIVCDNLVVLIREIYDFGIESALGIDTAA